MLSRFTNFVRQLLTLKSKDATDRASETAVAYEGYTIHPTPRREGSQWLTAGVITKAFADGIKEHHFVRADTHVTKDGADAFSIAKAKQIIDEQGDRLFPDG